MTGYERRVDSHRFLEGSLGVAAGAKGSQTDLPGTKAGRATAKALLSA